MELHILIGTATFFRWSRKLPKVLDTEGILAAPAASVETRWAGGHPQSRRARVSRRPTVRPKCAGPMRVIALIADLQPIRRIQELTALGPRAGRASAFLRS